MSAKRLSVTSAQLESAVGLELVQVLETITADGKIDVRECDELADWLLKNQGSSLPAVGHLLEVLHRITSDGKVDADELAYLQGEVERVLPPEFRAAAKLARRKAWAEEKARRASQLEVQRQQVRELASVDRFDFLVAGVAYDGRAEFIAAEQGQLEGAEVLFLRMPDNPYDANAVLVVSRGGELGYVPRDDAAVLAEMLDSGHRYRARVKKLWQGARNLMPVIEAQIYAPEHPLAFGQAAEQVRYGSRDYRAKRVGDRRSPWFFALVLAVVIGVTVALWLKLRS